MDKLNLSADEVLTTTRAVRKRLDFDRPVSMDVIRDCMEIALQAPSGSNSQDWQFVIVTDRDKIAAIAEHYATAFTAYEQSPFQPTTLHQDEPDMAATQERVLSSAQYLATNLHRVPALMIPCATLRLDMEGISAAGIAGITGSVLPAVWSFMLAARERGLGTCWTTLHLDYEREIGELLGIPEHISQLALIPIAYTKGTQFRPAHRKSMDGVLHINGW